MPPRGINDYRLLKFGNEMTEIDENFNYYIKVNGGKKHYFLFNNFKTKKTYGPIKIKIFDTELIKIIDVYITVMEIDENELFFPNFEKNTNNFVEKLNRTIEKYTSMKHISIDILRDSYVAYLRNTGQLDTCNSRTNMSYLMGHKITNIKKYYKHPNERLSDNVIEQKYLFYTPYDEDETQVYLPYRGSDEVKTLPCDKISLNALSIVANSIRKKNNRNNADKRSENGERTHISNNLVDILKKLLGS